MDSDLMRHVEDYLRLRRSLGSKLARPGVVLPQLVTWLHATGATTITVDAAVAWAASPPGVSPISKVHRLGAVRGFARYLQTITQPPRSLRPTCSPVRSAGRIRTCIRRSRCGLCWGPPAVFARRSGLRPTRCCSG
jgi:hypothetical protein